MRSMPSKLKRVTPAGTANGEIAATRCQSPANRAASKRVLEVIGTDTSRKVEDTSPLGAQAAIASNKAAATRFTALPA